MPHAVLQVRHRSKRCLRRRSRPARNDRTSPPSRAGRLSGGRDVFRTGSGQSVGAEPCARSQFAPPVSQGYPGGVGQSRVCIVEHGGLHGIRPDRGRSRRRGHCRRRGEPLRHPHSSFTPFCGSPPRVEQSEDTGASPATRLGIPATRLGSRDAGDRRAFDRRVHGAVGREDGKGERDKPASAGRVGTGEPRARTRGDRRRQIAGRNRSVFPRPRNPDRSRQRRPLSTASTAR